jgi:hypothetical protein
LGDYDQSDSEDDFPQSKPKLAGSKPNPKDAKPSPKDKKSGSYDRSDSDDDFPHSKPKDVKPSAKDQKSGSYDRSDSDDDFPQSKPKSPLPVAKPNPSRGPNPGRRTFTDSDEESKPVKADSKAPPLHFDKNADRFIYSSDEDFANRNPKPGNLNSDADEDGGPKPKQFGFPSDSDDVDRVFSGKAPKKTFDDQDEDFGKPKNAVKHRKAPPLEIKKSPKGRFSDEGDSPRNGRKHKKASDASDGEVRGPARQDKRRWDEDGEGVKKAQRWKDAPVYSSDSDAH